MQGVPSRCSPLYNACISSHVTLMYGGLPTPLAEGAEIQQFEKYFSRLDGERAANENSKLGTGTGT